MDDAKLKMFRAELKAILEEYKASIGFSVGPGSDTFGLYDEKMVVCFGGVEVFEVNGWSIEPSDLR